MNEDLRAIEASKKTLARKAARDRRLLTRLLCGAFLALTLTATFAALRREQAAPTLISARAATLTTTPEPETDKAVAVLVTATPKKRQPRRQRRVARRRAASKAAACRCECGNLVARN